MQQNSSSHKRININIVIIRRVLTTADYWPWHSAALALELSSWKAAVTFPVLVRSYLEVSSCVPTWGHNYVYATKCIPYIPFCGWFHRVVEIHTVQLGYPPPRQHSDAGRKLFQVVAYWSRTKYNLAYRQIYWHPLEPGTYRWSSSVSINWKQCSTSCILANSQIHV